MLNIMDENKHRKQTNIGIGFLFALCFVGTAFSPIESMPYFNVTGVLVLAIGGMLAAFVGSGKQTPSSREIWGMGGIAFGGIMVFVATIRPLLASAS